MDERRIGDATVVVLGDKAELAREAARRLADALHSAISERGEAHVALTGGSSAAALYKELIALEWREAFDWERVHLWWGDDRFVPVDHPESNAGLAYSMLLSAGARSGESGTIGASPIDVGTAAAPAVPVPPENIHPFQVDEAMSESDAAELVAELYAEEMKRVLPADENGLPILDVVLLGVGGDGHIMSVFPGSPALADDAPLVLTIPAPEHIGPHLPRVTLNPRLLAAARSVLVMVSGSDKAEVVGEILRGPRDPQQLPAQLAVRSNAVWLLDRAVAARLSA